MPESVPSDRNPLLRTQLRACLRGGGAHLDPRTAIASVEAVHYSMRPPGAPHTPWQLLEHMRFTLRDLLDFCTDPDYVAPDWPQDYWPGGEAPPNAKAWQQSADQLLSNLAAFEALVDDPQVDLLARIPWGDGQTILREVLLAIDHTSYHLGQLVLVRKQLSERRS